MKNRAVAEKLIAFIHENSKYPGVYWVPLVKLKNKLPVIAYDIDLIYKNNDMDLLERVFRKCGIRNVNIFQMDHLSYFEDENIYELLYEQDEDGYTFPWSSETFFFDCTEKWMIYVSHEGTISFTGEKIVRIADEVFSGKYEISEV